MGGAIATGTVAIVARLVLVAFYLFWYCAQGTYHNLKRGAVDVRAGLAIGVVSMAATAATSYYVTASVPDKELRYALTPPPAYTCK